MEKLLNIFVVALFISLISLAQSALAAGGFISQDNTTTTAINTGVTYTGTWETNALNDISVEVFTDQSGILYIDFSSDGGTNVDETVQFAVAASVHEQHILFKGPRSFRVRFTNDSGSNQTEIRLTAYFGEFIDIRHPVSAVVDDDDTAILVRTFPLDVMLQQGLQRGYSIVDKFGSNLSASTTEETIRSYSTGRVVYPDVGGVALTLSSGDVDDTILGAGARTVKITWHNASNVAQETTVNMNGQTAVAIGTGIRSYRAEVLTVGATGSNEGILYIGSGTVTTGVPAIIYSTVALGANQTEQSFFTIEAGKTGYIHDLHITSIGSGNADATIRVLSRKNLGQANEPFVVKRTYVVGQQPLNPPGFIGGPFTEGTDIEMTVDMSTGSGGVGAEFKVLIIDD